MRRAARYSGRIPSAAYGAVSWLSTELNTRKTFERGSGVMFEPEPCSRLQSNQSAEPAAPVNCSIPSLSTALVRVFSSGTPNCWATSDELWWLSGVAPTHG